MVAILSNILLRMFAPKRSEEVEGNLTPEDLLEVEPQKDEHIKELNKDCNHIRKKTDTWIIALIPMISTILTSTNNGSSILLCYRLAQILCILIIVSLIIFDGYLYYKTQKLIDKRLKKIISNEEIEKERKTWKTKAQIVERIKYFSLGIVVVIAIILLIYN